jgi:hypothetical protein
MKTFDYTGLWALIYNPDPACADPKSILKEFADELQTYCRSEQFIAERMRSLDNARIELRISLESLQSGAGKKCATA